MKKLLLTGTAGFLGRTITRYFSQKGWQILGIDRVANENAPLADLKEYVTINLPNPQLSELLQTWQPDVCIHAAGRASVPLSMQDPSADFQDGPALVVYLLDSLRQYSPRCAFVFLSSAAVYGNPVSLPVSEEQCPSPISAYGYHKWQSEILCREYAHLFGLKTASARLFSAYGPGLRRQVMWDICYKALTHHEVLLHGDGTESRDFLHALDIAHALDCILTSASMKGEVYNVASGRETAIAYLSDLIINNLGSTIRSQFSGDLPGGTPRNWCADISKISALGFTPRITLEDGVGAFAGWCRHELQGYDE
jgi:UDP-glucose 4-epimerase